eukprot:2350987-Karenia_brevis.AAC.1
MSPVPGPAFSPAFWASAQTPSKSSEKSSFTMINYAFASCKIPFSAVGALPMWGVVVGTGLVISAMPCIALFVCHSWRV